MIEVDDNFRIANELIHGNWDKYYEYFTVVVFKTPDFEIVSSKNHSPKAFYTLLVVAVNGSVIDEVAKSCENMTEKLTVEWLTFFAPMSDWYDIVKM